MGSYEATLIAGQTLEFTIPAPCYRFQATCVSTSAQSPTFITGDGTQPVDPATAPQEAVLASTQVVLPGNTGAQVQVRPPLPGSVVGGQPAGGTTFPQVLMLSTGAPTVIVEW